MWKSIIDIIKQANVNKFENFLVATISIHEYDFDKMYVADLVEVFFYNFSVDIQA
jgi:hypothetical protein